MRSGTGRALTMRILAGMAAGMIVGLVLNLAAPPLAGAADDAAHGWVRVWLADGAFHVVGEIFLRLLRVTVVPLVFVSLVCGTAAVEDIARVGRIGVKAMTLYLGTTAFAITLALTVALICRPGAGFTIAESAEYAPAPPPALTQVLIDLVPANIVQAMARGDMLPIIVFALLAGLALTTAGDAGKRIQRFLQDANEVIMRLVWLIMQLAPFGVFALIARTFANEGFSAFVPLLQFAGVVLGVLVLHMFAVYGTLLRLVAGVSPVRFFAKMRDVMVFALSTASSNATLPVSLQTCEKKLGVSRTVASFTIPLGATINMDGTAIMQGVATVFIAQVYGIDLSLLQLLVVILMVTLASVGTAGVPGAGLIMLAMVLQQVELPAAGIGLIIGIDRILDMARTVVNVTGDCVVSCLVARSEREWDVAVFNDRHAR